MKSVAKMVEDGWQQRFEDPIPLADGRTILTLRQATDYITSLTKSESGSAEWRIASEALDLASRAGSTALARIAFVNALNCNSRKATGIDAPFFAVRLLDGGSGYVIDAVWGDGRIEQIAGVLFYGSRFRRSTGSGKFVDIDQWAHDRCLQYHSVS
jgi:hypothetical protein